MQVIQAEGDSVITGTWYGTTAIPGIGNSSATFSLVQSGANVTGTFAIIGFGSGGVTGTVSGGVLSFTVTETSPCPGTFTGTATSDDGFRSMVGSFSGTDCDGFWSANIAAVNLAARGSGNGVNVHGTWIASFTVGGVQASARITLVQAGTSLTGTAAIVGRGSGTMIGYVDGPNVRLTTFGVSPCPGLFIAAGTVSGDGRTMSGSGGGQDCGGTYSGTFSGTKQ
jgi:hypothetical protein